MTFRRELTYSGRSSVDAFLEHRPEFLEVGKLTIALALMPFEEEHRLFEISPDRPSWYEYLYEKLNAPFQSFDKNRLSIITFNYDRSLDQYLFRALKHSYGQSDQECAKKLNSIPLIHVHGCLGRLPWQGIPARHYTANYRSTDIEVASKQIVVVPEDLDTSPAFDEAFRIMTDAQRIYFLGFGYNHMNLKRLSIDQLRGKCMIGTAYGLGKTEWQGVQDKWAIDLALPYDEVSVFLKDHALLD